MHFVAALDDVPAMHSVLALFEGVATGAADGYARLAGRPAATLLHLGPGLGNGLANLHNARRARSPVVNIVGDHAITHRAYDAQLQSDIETVARNVSIVRPHLGVDGRIWVGMPSPPWPPPPVHRARWPPSSSRPTCRGPTAGWWWRDRQRPPPAGRAPDAAVTRRGRRGPALRGAGQPC